MLIVGHTGKRTCIMFAVRISTTVMFAYQEASKTIWHSRVLYYNSYMSGTFLAVIIPQINTNLDIASDQRNL